MKTLELNQMENLQGGSHTATGIGVACVAVGIASLVGSFFTFGATLALGIAYGGAFCTGFAIGTLMNQ